ncbi:MAG TPA: VOC family protein [Gemmatimonadaceae bacterium]|nr:VOC family protein [Gemmatimonadaceae bacterium]
MNANLNASAVVPGITASDLERSVYFYTDGLGFEVEEQNERDGKVVYVSLKAGGASIGLSRDDFAKGKDRVKGIGIRLWFQTDTDLKLLANRVKAAGFQLDAEPAPLPWGPLAFQLKDPDGIAITISNS